MLFQKKSVLFGCIVTLAILLSSQLITSTSSQESQQSRTPLKDVCQAGRSRYQCGGDVRVCVSTEIESHYDLANSIRWHTEACHPDQTLIPDAWTRATSEETGYLAQAWRWKGYNFYIRVINFDLSMIKAGDLEGAIRALPMHQWQDGNGYDVGFAKFEAHGPERPLESYGITLPTPKVPVAEVCPTAWSRFSCQFVRLCVSPDVAAKYDLASSEEFGYAKCKADDRSVPVNYTHTTPHDVGFAAGSLLLGPRYFSVVKLDSSDIFDGNIEEAIQRLVLVPVPTSGLMEYDQGYEEGQKKFKDYLAKDRQRESEGSHKVPN